MKRSLWVVFLLFLTISIISGCAKQGESSTKDEVKTDTSTKPAADSNQKPITLSFYNIKTFTDSEYKKLIEEPIKKKFPYITLVKIDRSKKLKDLIAAGNVPDIIFGGIKDYHELNDLGLIEDLGPYINKYKFDISRIKPVILDSIKTFTDNGQIYALPFNDNVSVLYYNKDIFDKFGVPYPSDKHTYDQLIEIGRKLTKENAGKKYIGLDLAFGPAFMQEALQLPTLDYKTGKSLVTTNPDWVRVFKTYQKLFEIPGQVQGEKYAYGIKQFIEEQTLAMRIAPLANMEGSIEDYVQAGKVLNYDFAPMPNFQDKLGTGPESSIHSLYITSTSKNKDEAFKVISYFLSDESQLKISRNGRVPSIVNDSLEKEFGQDLKSFQGKKIENIFTVKPVVLHKANRFEDQILDELLTPSIGEIALKHLDVNTVLRDLDDKINKKVAQLQKGK